MLPYAEKASSLQTDIYPLIKINQENLDLNQSSQFFTNITDFVCKNYPSEFCDGNLPEDLNTDDMKKIDASVDDLINKVAKYKQITIKKFDALQSNLEHVK